MNFSEWTKNKKRKNQQVDLQETTKEPSAAPAAKASSFAEWTKGQTAAKSENAGQSRNAGPQSFSEWVRENRGDSTWREEDVAVRQRNDYISDYSQRANREFTAQRNRYVAPETAAQRQTEAASQAKAARNAGTEILQAMRQSGRYSDEETRQALERLTAGDDVMEAVRKNAENDTAFRSQFQTEDQYNSWKKWQEYENLRNNPDFAEKSKYKSTANNSKPSVIDILADNYRADNSGWDDPLYEYVNGNQEAGAYLYNRANSVYGSGGNALGALYGNVADSKTEAVQMTDDERALFNYIYATQGKYSAHEYYEAIQSGLNARQREQDMRALQEYASERPVEASFLSVLESPLKGLSYIGQASDYLSGGSIDQNAGYNRFAYYGSSIRGKVSDTIANSGKWGKVGSFLYQTGMSMGDFLLNTALTGGFGVDAAATPALAKGVEALSLAIMGTGAAADATIEAKDRGLTDTQAFTLGTIAGAAEIVTEKVSIEALLDKTTLGRDAVGYLLKNTLAEGSEEVASDLINLIADILVTKDKSQWHEAIQGYEAQGLSEKDAWWRAVLDQAEEMGVDFLGGALSGGVMAGTGIAINSGVNDYYARQNGRMILDADAVQDTIDSGLTMGENTRAYQQARDLMARVSEGQDVAALQIGRLYGENVQALDAETKAGDLLLQAAREAAEHGTISNNRALDILDSPAALDTLISETGVEIREDMTRAQQRRAVKSAVEALASETTDISAPGNEPVTVNTESRQEAATAPVQATTENRNPALKVFDGKQIAEAGKALGENGRKALTSTYAKASDSMSGADYYEAFSQYYQAGVTGKDMAEVNPQVEISPAQQFAAYVSGQNDAAAAAAREKTAAKYAKTAGDGSGLVYDAFVKEAVESGRTLENSRSAYLTAETAERINDVAKALGLRAQFVDSVEGGLANAQIQGDTVLIERNNPNPVMFLTGHEITHRIQELAPEQYRSFRQFVSENDTDFQDQVEAIQSLYESHGMEISYEKAMDEAAADYAGRLMEDGTLLDEFIQKNRKDKTLLEKVRDAIRAIINVLTGREKQQAQTAEGKLTAALEAAAREAETISQRTENAAQEGEKNTAMSGGKKYSVTRRYEDVDLSKDGRVYTYDFLTSLPDMKVVTLPEIGSLRGSDNRIDTGAVVRIGMENARAVGTVQDGKTYVQNRYTGHNLRIDNSSVRHGLNGGQNRLLTNSRLGAVIGDVVKNAVPINALHNKADGVIGTYAMAGYAVDSAGREFVSIVTVEQRSGEITGVESYDVTHAVSGRQKNSSQADTKSQGVYPIKAANTSIDSLIQNVNSTHQSILSDDVLKHLGETRNPNGDYTNRVKFSLKSPVEETKDLVALHNLTEDKLLKSIALGGFPMPSIAVTRQDIPHTNFGDITLVMDKGAIDPKASRKNTVYSADAWTPTVPRVEYEADPKAERRITTKLDQLGEKLDKHFRDSLHHVSYGMDELLNRYDGEAGVIEHAMENYGMKAAFLEEQGQHIDPITKQVEEDPGYSESRAEKYENVAKALGTRDPNKIGSMTMKEIRDQYGAELEQAFPGMTKSPFRMSGILNQVRAYLNADSGQVSYKTVTDTKAMERAVDEALDKPKYERWVRDLFSGLEGNSGVYNNKERFTPSGNRRSFQQTHYPATLEGITKAMVGQNGGDSRNVSGFYGVKSLRAGMAERFRDIADMHKAEGRLQNLTQAQLDSIQDNLNNRLFDLTSRIIETNPVGSDMQQADAVGNILMEIAEGKLHTIDEIERVFNKEYQYHVGNELAADVRNLLFDVSQMPVNMFEAKPERAVGFDEVLAAVVPDNASEKLVEALGEKGVRVIPYEAGNDTDRIQKVNSVEGAKFSQDLPELENLRKENQRLQAQVESWKGQMKRTTPKNRTVRQKDVDKLAKRLISAYDSTLDTAEVSTDLKKLGEYIVRGGDGKNELTWDSVHDSALTIGRKLVENALAADDSAYKAYTELRKYLRDTKITIGPEYAGDIPDFKAFKDSYKGKLRLSLGDKTNVDQVYQELSENWPELFSEAEEAHPTDQILRISDVLDGLTPIYENPHSYDMDRAAEYAAGDILDSIMGEDVRQEPPTFADKQARKLEDAVARERIKRSDTILAERMAAGRAIAKERTIRDQKLQALKDHYAEIQDRRRERREDSNARTRLLKIAKRLQNKKLPAVNRALLDQYIGDLDTAAKSMTGKTLKNLSELQIWYAGQKENNPDFIADPNVEKALSRLQKRQISSLTAIEVRDLTDVLLNIENEIRTQRKLIDSQDRRDVYHMGQDVIRDVYNTKGSWGGALDKYLVAETLSPVRQIRRMTGYVDTDPLYVLTQGLADGQRDMMAYQMRSSRPFEKFANDKKFNERFSGKKAEKIEIRGVTIQGQDVKVNITPAMRVSLYLHSLNDDNLRHIAGGGITIPDEKLYRKGDMGEAYARGVTIRMTPSDIRAITSKMTDQERSFAKAVQKYFNEDSKTSLNEVSEKLKGYPVAEVENYFPINTDSNFTRSEFVSLKRDGTIEGMGFLKERVVAKNPILLRDASDVVDQATRMHGKYVGLAIPVRNFNKVWNVTTAAYGEDGNSAYPTGSVQSAIESRWGKTGTKYVDKLMGDLQGSTQTKNVWAKALNNVRSNYARAVLTLNLSVAMKQAASYPTAAAVLGWKPLAQAMKDFGKVDLSLIEKYTPLQWYRSKGFSTKELGDMKSGGKSLPQGLNWVQGVDLITTRKLWKASEYYVRDYQKNLAVGSDEYYKAVAQIYNRVIEETQPNYTIMQRPQLLRSDDTLMGNLAMFKTQPFQNTGIVYDAVGNYLAKAEQAKYGGEKAKAEAKAARRNMGWAITSQLGQLAVFAGMTLVWALARGKKDKYEDEDGNLTAGSVLSAVGKDMVGGALSGIPFGSDAWELVSSKLFGDKYYGLDAVTVTAIQDTLEAMNSLTDQLGRIGKAALTGGEINWNSERLKLDTELDSFSKAVGVPYENVLNLGKVVVRQTVVRSLGQNVGEYAYLKLTTDPEKYPSDYYDVLYKAMGDNQEDYEKIYQDMLDFGFDEDKIRNAIEKRMKEDQGVKNVSDLDHRYLSPAQEDSWNGVYDGLSGSRLWGSATEAQRDAVEDKLYNVVTQNSAGEKLREKIDGGAAYGLDETEYMLYLLALSMADKPTESGKMGSYTNDEVAEAIRMVPGLTDEERSYLWTAQGKSDKSNPWG